MTHTPSNDPYFVERAIAIARESLRGNYDFLLACRDLADIRERLPRVSDDLMDVFVGVASETDGLPIGDERRHWAAEPLESKDQLIAGYRVRMQSAVIEALQHLLAVLGRDGDQGGSNA